MGNVVSFVQAHPILSSLLGLISMLAIVGLWYVLAHHLKQIVNTLICLAGVVSGVIVFWRGTLSDHVDLLTIGTFLILIFPVIFYQAIRRDRKPTLASVTHMPGVVLKHGDGQPRRPA